MKIVPAFIDITTLVSLLDAEFTAAVVSGSWYTPFQQEFALMAFLV
jgi:hypothetical protein